jgi:2,3-bisphosphoglycerate-dependent phosphoglycerate mutase
LAKNDFTVFIISIGMTYLVLARHGQTVNNEKGIWTGIHETDLTTQGELEASELGRYVRALAPDTAWRLFVSPLSRTKKTAAIAVRDSGVSIGSLTVVPELIERDYGMLSGKNKWEVQQEVGEEEFLKIRRSFEYQPVEGESLAMVYKRVIPWYTSVAVPVLQTGQSVWIVAHGNSLRALVKYIDSISDQDIASFELQTGAPRVYSVKNLSGKVSYTLVE